MMRIGILLSMCLLASHAQSAEPVHAPIRAGDNFVRARGALLRAQWRPLRRHVNDGYEYGGLDRLLNERGFKELESCTVDTSQCIFYYRKRRTCLRVDTMGEQVDEMTVVQWSTACPDEPSKTAH